MAKAETIILSWGQINELMLCDELSKLPIFDTCVSGHVHDKISFINVFLTIGLSMKSQVL